ncbi:hypothetical protein Sru01_29170 [Sphaerisporangium rufum]|uniref:Uncharacterized protein n=2 Tax=Sphaerisporangium rufum TaxID=1381558 RepID=A0A919R404_9ACTN|nr:hypothetical protein Sru01_29170 [Sphaerisporangium rufum]
MIPQLVTIRHRRDGRVRRLYIPVVPLLLVLSPLLLPAVAASLITCLFYQVRPVRALYALGRLLWTLPGTRIEYVEGRTALLVSVR